MRRQDPRPNFMTSAFLKCIEQSCQQRYPLDAKEHQCPECGGLLDVQYDFPRIDPASLRLLWQQRKTSSAITDQSGVWRFRELLPFAPEGTNVVSLSEGRTPLIEVNRTGEWAGGVRLAIKHQGNNPTGSFKDLGMTACITQAAILGSRVTACASTGNTSASMAAYAARAGMKAVVFVPFGKISTAKLAQALEFGAVVIEMGDNFDQAFRMLRELTDELGLYLVNSLNPFRLEGQKTIVFEILEQRDWRVPDYLVLPGGNLGNVSSVGKGLQELRQLGLIDKLPRLVVVQAEGASPFYTMIATGAGEITPVQPRTEASAIRIGNPVNWKKALRAVRLTDGLCESVTDEQIFEAKATLAKDGVGCEPASAAAVAGTQKLVRSGKIEDGADVVAVLTGHQLKDPEISIKRRSERELAQQRLHVEADIHKLRAVLESVMLQSA
ncbi:MAG: threonine synthase [Acidobacteria bacterium]|nr:MAG: threonine synthase [Acidobacteriota bacterium]